MIYWDLWPILSHFTKNFFVFVFLCVCMHACHALQPPHPTFFLFFNGLNLELLFFFPKRFGERNWCCYHWMLKFILKNALELLTFLALLKNMNWCSFHCDKLSNLSTACYNHPFCRSYTILSDFFNIMVLLCIMYLLTVNMFLHTEICHTMRYQEVFLHGLIQLYDCMSLESLFMLCFILIF